MFKTLKTLLSNPNDIPEDDEINKISSYVMLHWLEGNQFTVIPANIINLNYNIPVKNQYRFLKDYFILTGINKKVRYIKYNKQTKDDSELLDNICRYYNINTYNAKKYLQLMTKEDKKKFKDLYKEGKV
jgi:hypothetical protein